MVWRRQFLCPGSHRCRRLGFRSHTHTSRMRMMATALPATSISRMVLARLATCCNYKPTIRFQKFFDRLAADGIDKSNTLFVFTVDEGDHFAGDAPTPAGCDGVTTPCTYNRVGEINADLRRMVYTQFGDSTLFSVHSDDAPTVYVNGTSAQ